MKRFVTYIYEYERGVKGKNTGFIKADIRGNDCRMEIHLRGLNGIRGKGKVYVLVKEEGLIGIEIGEVMLSGGKGDFRTVFRVNPIQDTSYGFQDIVGVCAVYGGGQLSASQWRGEEPISFTVSDIQIWEKPQTDAMGEEAEPELVSEAETDVGQRMTGGAAAESGRQSGNGEVLADAEVRESGQPADVAVRGSERPADAAERRSEQPTDAEARGSEQSADEAERRSEQQDDATLRGSAYQTENNIAPETVSDPVLEAHAAARAKNIFPDNASLVSKWEELQPGHQALSLASENQSSWIKMEIKELRDLPKRFWYLGNNSFLLHGFFNYHHILFGKEETEQGTIWYLGVPGVFQKEERVMAALFGFSGFCPLTGKTSEGSFGYWMHTLEKG